MAYGRVEPVGNVVFGDVKAPFISCSVIGPRASIACANMPTTCGARDRRSREVAMRARSGPRADASSSRCSLRALLAAREHVGVALAFARYIVGALGPSSSPASAGARRACAGFTLIVTLAGPLLFGCSPPAATRRLSKVAERASDGGGPAVTNRACSLGPTRARCRAARASALVIKIARV